MQDKPWQYPNDRQLVVAALTAPFGYHGFRSLVPSRVGLGHEVREDRP